MRHAEITELRPEVVNLGEAARQLGVSRRTIGRWLAAGAPHEIQGRQRLVSVEALVHWRRGDALGAIARALFGVWRRDGGDGAPVWRSLNMDEARVIALLIATFDRAVHELSERTGELPPEVRHMMSRLVSLQRHQPERRR